MVFKSKVSEACMTHSRSCLTLVKHRYRLYHKYTSTFLSTQILPNKFLLPVISDTPFNESGSCKMAVGIYYDYALRIYRLLIAFDKISFIGRCSSASVICDLVISTPKPR